MDFGRVVFVLIGHRVTSKDAITKGGNPSKNARAEKSIDLNQIDQALAAQPSKLSTHRPSRPSTTSQKST
jgi:hypothetical protein